MDCFFELDSGGELPWFDVVVEVNQSAFTKYTPKPIQELGSNQGNVNKRMVNFLKNSWKPIVESVEAERERNHKHMINERMRREKEKQSYIELNSLLPHGTKRDKNSIVQMATKTIEELERQKEELQRKNYELEMATASATDDDDDHYFKKMEEAKISMRIAHPSSGIDSMLEVLKCLKSTGSTAKVISSSITAKEFSAFLHIETKMRAAQVEKAVRTALFEVERKLRCQFSEEYGKK